MIIIKLILFIFIIIFYNSPLNCEETIKEDSTKEETIENNNTENTDAKWLRLMIISTTIAFQLGVNPEEPSADKIKYLILLVYTSVLSTMIGRWSREILYGKDPKTQLKIEEDLKKDIQNLSEDEEN